MKQQVLQLIYDVNIAINSVINAILHQEAFQRLEANWLQLKHLVTPIDNSNYCVYILPASDIDQLIADNILLNLCYNKRYQMPGAIPFSILCLLPYAPLPYTQLNVLAQQVFLPIIIPADKTPASLPAFIYSLAPQMLLRVPYHMEQVTFLDNYLWGNPCFYFLEIILKKKPFSTCFHNRHFRYLNPNSQHQQLWLFQSNFEERNDESGRLSIISLLIFCRFVHCLKIQLRDKLGQFSSYEDAERQLQAWINRYCSQLAYQNYYPLKHAAILLKPSHAANGYICHIHMTLHMADCTFSHCLDFHSEFLC